ncbi:hypothetical protein ACMD2_26594, partial [Ananas comosus]
MGGRRVYEAKEGCGVQRRCLRNSTCSGLPYYRYEEDYTSLGIRRRGDPKKMMSGDGYRLTTQLREKELTDSRNTRGASDLRAH